MASTSPTSKSASVSSASDSPNGNPLVVARGGRFGTHLRTHGARDNPEAARRVAQTIYDGCTQLKGFPYIGRASSRMTGRRELVFVPPPYIVVYQVTETAVEASRIFHGAQDWP